MTSRRAFNSFRKMRPGTLGGQSRIATPVEPKTLINPVPDGSTITAPEQQEMP